MRAKSFNTPAFLGNLSNVTFGVIQFVVIALYLALAQSTKIQITDLVFAFSFGSLLFLVSSSFWVRLSDKYGRQPILRIGLAGLMISFSMIVYLTKEPLIETQERLYILIASRIIYGLTASAIVPVVQSWWRDQSGSLIKNMLSHSMSLNAGRVLAALIGIIFADNLAALLEVLLAWTVALSAVSFFARNTTPKSHAAVNLKFQFFNRIIGLAFFSTVAVGLLQGSLAKSLQQAFTLSTEETTANTSKYLLLMGLVTLLCQWLISRLSSKKSLLSFTTVPFFISLIAFSVAFVPGKGSLTALIIAGISFSTAMALIVPGYLALEGSSSLVAEISIAQTLGLSLGGMLSYLSLSGRFEFFYIMLVPMTLLYVFINNRGRKNFYYASRELELQPLMQSFFNSYVRDMTPPYNENEKAFEIPLNGQPLKLKVRYFSKLGSHTYHEKLEYNGELIDFLTAAEMLTKGTEIYSRLKESIDVIQLHISGNSKFFFNKKTEFLPAEQGIVFGHNFHPTPKTREGFSLEDLKSYSPEGGSLFNLHWISVQEKFLFQETSHSFKGTNWQKELFTGSVQPGRVPLPVHPWQWGHLKKSDPIIQKYLADGTIQELGPGSDWWSPTSSLRTVYCADKPYMLKFSLSIRMTNSIRHLQEKEVGRGMLIQDAFLTLAGKEFSARFPQFRVMHEPAYAGILTPTGQLLPQTIVLLRENIIPEKNQIVVLAALNQHVVHSAYDRMIGLINSHSPEKWFEAFLENVVTPLMVAQADYGIMLGAHQQNLLVELKNGLPVGSYFRDCQGTGFSELGKDLMLNTIPDKDKFLANIVPNEAAEYIFTYYFIINSVMSTIAALAGENNELEDQLIHMFQIKMNKLRTNVKDPFIINFILKSPVLYQKGNFRCSLENLNENTTANPLAIYNPIKNPLRMEHSL